MKRRRHTPADSLDLLLDTICNTFGGIIFIALLVVMLLLISGRSGSRQSPIQRAEEVDLRHQLETLTGLKSRLESSLEQQTETISKLAPNDIENKLNNYKKEMARHAELKTNISRLHDKIHSTEQESKELSKQDKELQSSLELIQSQTEDLKRSLTRQRDSRRKTLKMPTVHSPRQETQVIVVLQFNRFYIWHRYSFNGIREGLNTDDFLILSDETKGIITTPNPAAGIPLDQTNETKQRIIQELSRFHPNRYHLAVIVRPDSYGSFQYLREAIAQLKLEYDLQPTTTDAEWFDRGGSGGFVQ